MSEKEVEIRGQLRARIGPVEISLSTEGPDLPTHALLEERDTLLQRLKQINDELKHRGVND